MDRDIQRKRLGAALCKRGHTNQGDVLEATAMQAHELARFLRQYHYDAYVLHTRCCSIVTVGGFALQGDQDMMKMKQELGKFHLKGDRTAIGSQSINPNEDPFALLPDPMPMRVPKF